MAVAATIFLITFNGVVFGGVLEAINRDLGAFQYGHLEILNEKEGFIDKPYHQVIAVVSRHPLVEAAAPRLESLTEVSYTTARGVKTVYDVRTLGIDPLFEARASQVLRSVIAGEPEVLKNTALVGRDLAKDLGIGGPGVLIKVKVRNALGLEVSKQLRVAGIMESSAAGGLNNILVIHFDTLQEMLGLEGKYATSIIVKLREPEGAEEVEAWIEAQFPDYEAKTVEEAAKVLINAVREGVAFINLVGYAGMIASALAVITVLTMMVSGKTRDIGVLRALGISRKGIILLFIFDGALIGLIGAGLGGLISSLVVLYFEVYPVALFGGLVLEVKFNPLELLVPMIVGFTISVLASIYPAWRASTYEPAEAMRYF